MWKETVVANLSRNLDTCPRKPHFITCIYTLLNDVTYFNYYREYEISVNFVNVRNHRFFFFIVCNLPLLIVEKYKLGNVLSFFVFYTSIDDNLKPVLSPTTISLCLLSTLLYVFQRLTVFSF
jgi:hypothetical protein